MNDTRIEISTCGKPQGGYVVSINTRSRNQISDYRVVMTKDELKELRDMLHNVLLDLDSELNTNKV